MFVVTVWNPNGKRRRILLTNGTRNAGLPHKKSKNPFLNKDSEILWGPAGDLVLCSMKRILCCAAFLLACHATAQEDGDPVAAKGETSQIETAGSAETTPVSTEGDLETTVVQGAPIVPVETEPVSREQPRPAPVSTPAVTPVNTPVEPAAVELQSDSTVVLQTDLIGGEAAGPASVTVFGADEINSTPVFSYGDVLRPVSGVTVNNFGQGGVGYGISLRGFPSGSHGRDVAVFVDGIPMNEPAGTPTGYVDLNPLIPELIESVEVVRGPVSVRSGNYALGGTINFRTLSRPSSALGVSAGSYDRYRGYGTYGADLEKGHVSVSGVGSTVEGYRDNSGLDELNALATSSFPLGGGHGVLRFQGYQNTYGAPGYLDRDLVESGQLDERAAIDTSDGGHKDFASVGFNWINEGIDANRTETTLWWMHNDFSRYANFGTVPGTGNQGVREINFNAFGGRFEQYFGFTDSVGLLAGLDHRSDIGSFDRANTIRRRPINQTHAFDYSQHNTGGYLLFDYKPVDWLKLTGGTRYDHFFFDVDDKMAGTSVNPNTGDFSPTLGLAVNPVDGLSIFANYAEGLRSPSIVEEIPFSPNLETADQQSYEIGTTYESEKWYLLASLYHSELSGEIQAAPANADFVNLGKSRRIGADLEARYRIQENSCRLEPFVTASWIDAELLDGAGGSVPGVPEYTFGGGFDSQWPAGKGSAVYGFGAHFQYIGPTDLTADGRLGTSAYPRLSGKLRYGRPDFHNLQMHAGVISYPGSTLEESAFDFGDTVAVSPQAPVAVEFGVQVNF